MSESASGQPPILDRQTTLAFERTRVAYEATMMSWIRTGTSLITFGFSVYKFFNLEMTGRPMAQGHVGAREFGLVLIVIGLLSLLLGTLEHGRDLRMLRRQYPAMPRSPTRAVAIVVTGLGLAALAAVILRA